MQSTQIESTTETERAYAALRHAILHGEFVPSAKLKMEDLKTRYNMGGSPLREALARLVSERLVTFSGGRGFRVASISIDDLEDIADVRKVLEIAALREAIERGDDEWEGRIVAAFHRLSLAEGKLNDNPESMTEVEERNREFHRALLSAAKSPRLLELAEAMYDLHERYRRISRLKRSSERNLHEEHSAIMNAALARDFDRASELTAAHIDATTRTVAAHLQYQAARAAN